MNRKVKSNRKPEEGYFCNCWDGTKLCGEYFESYTELMYHIRDRHKDVVE